MSGARRGVAAFLLAAGTATAVVLIDDTAAGPSLKVAGPAELVFDWSRSACEPEHIPDAPARAFRDFRGRVQLILAHHENRRLVGPGLDRLKAECTVLMDSTEDPRPSAFDDRAWLAALATGDGRHVTALVHQEYQGHRHPGRCPPARYEPCWYNAITAALSTDGGETYHRPPGRHLVAALPYRYAAGRGPYGLFSPSGIVLRPEDRHYYFFLRARRYERQLLGSCLARTRDPADADSWRAWDGEEFSIRFADPYARPAPSPERHVCEPVARDEIAEMTESLTYNTYLDRFLLVGPSSAPRPGHTEPVFGIYFSASEDLLHWTPRKLLMEAESPQSGDCAGRRPIAYPSLLDPRSDSRTFSTTGRRPYLYLTRFNSCERTLDRDLVRVPLELSR